MKKKPFLLLIFCFLIVLLSACTSIKHEHIVGDWQDGGEHHWRPVSCTWNRCDINPVLENHVDEDKNDICDICGSMHEHIFGDWQYSESIHWCSAMCTWNGCDIDTAAEHFDEDKNDICDVCGYEMISKQKEILNITDNSYKFGIPEGNEIFYSDRHGFYMFVGRFSEYIIVTYADGTTENVRDALRNGHIQISDLDKYEIEYFIMSMSQMASSIARFTLTLDDLKAIVERQGEDLTWSHFYRYCSWEIGSGLYILYYPIDDNYSLLIGGGGPNSSPDYVYLVYKNNMDNSIDVRYESIDDFLAQMAGLEASSVAKIVVDYENNLRAEIDKLRKEHPENIYYYRPVDEIHCAYILDRSASADDIVTKYDMNNAFSKAEVLALNGIKMVSIIFARNDFTEELHQRIIQISEEEPLIENLFIDMQRAWVESYMPKIEYYADDAASVYYEIIANVIKLDDDGLIIKSKEEYDSYLDDLLERAEYDYLREMILEQRDLYDEAFFEENALIITNTITRSSCSIKLTVNNLYISQNKLYVVVRTDVPGIGDDAIQYTSFTIKVPKSDVINITEVITLE